MHPMVRWEELRLLLVVDAFAASLGFILEHLRGRDTHEAQQRRNSPLLKTVVRITAIVMA